MTPDTHTVTLTQVSDALTAELDDTDGANDLVHAVLERLTALPAPPANAVDAQGNEYFDPDPSGTAKTEWWHDYPLPAPPADGVPRTAFDVISEAWRQDFNSLDAFIATLHKNGYEIRPIEAEAAQPAPGLDVETLGLSAEQTTILRDHLVSRQQTISEFLGDVLMDLGLGRATGRDYPTPARLRGGER